jgi:AraC-like DNA-binding protein
MIRDKSLDLINLKLLHAGFTTLDETWHYHNVVSPFTRIYCITDGRGQVEFDNEHLALEPGHLYLIPGYTRSNYKCTGYMKQYYLHVFTGLAGSLDVYDYLEFTHNVPAGADDEALFHRLVYLNKDKRLNDYDPQSYDNKPELTGAAGMENVTRIAQYLEGKGLLLQILSRFVSGEKRRKSDVRESARIRNAVYYINTHLHREIRITELSDFLCLSPDYFSRLFARITGYRPREYINRKKIERAQELLLSTERSIGQIAAETGFADVAYFTRMFKKVAHCTPMTFRKQQAGYG